MIEHFVPNAGSFAGDIDNLILLIGVLVGFWFFATEGMFFWMLWKFRRKEGVRTRYVTGKEKHLKRWVNIPHMLIIVCDAFIIVAAVRVWHNVKQDLPEDPDYEIRIIGQQWAWSFVHPGADGALDTEDDIKTVDELHIETDKTYVFELESRDVMHSFSVAAFRLKQDAVPGRTIKGWFHATKTGLFDIQCAEMCGIGHGIMAASLHIETPEEHQAWIRQAAN